MISQSALTLFCWLFLSQQGLAAIPNPCVTFVRCFSDDFRVDSDIVFVDYFWVNKGCGRSRIHESPLEVISLSFMWQQGRRALSNPRITFRRFFGDDFQSAPTPFSLTFSEWVGSWALPNERVTFGRCFGNVFLVGTDSVFVDFFLSQEGLRALPNKHVTFGRLFGDYF
jgi:hypothetical protein